MNMICSICGEEKEDVSVRPDVFAREMNNEEDALMISCDECAEQNALDI